MRRGLLIGMAPALAAGFIAAAAAPASAQLPCPPGVELPGCAPGGPGPGVPLPPPPPPEEPPPPPCEIARPAGRGSFVGLVSEQIYAGGDAYRRCALSDQARAGVRLLRQPLRWRDIEQEPGEYTFTYVDRYMRAVAEHGIQLMPILFDPPDWRSSRPEGNTEPGIYPPSDFKEMGVFAAAVVRRYGSKGSFWGANSDVPKVPIRAWQVWNEPNFPHYWPPKPNAREYVALQRTVAKAIRKADRKATVITAGLPQSEAPGAVPLTKFVKAMYKAGARGSFDALAINAYARSAKELIKRVKAVRKVMKRRRDRSKIWVTEIGWATEGPKSRYTVSRKKQAHLIATSLRAVGKARRKLGISGVVYYNWQDAPPYREGFDFWGLHTGLLDSEGKPKPGLAAFKAGAKRLRKAR